MKLSKNKIISAVLIMAILAAVFWWGGSAPGLQGWQIQSKADVLSEANTSQNFGDNLADSTVNGETAKQDINDKPIEQPGEVKEPEEKPAEEANQKPDYKQEPKLKQVIVNKPEEADKSKEGLESRPGGFEGGFTAQEKLDLAKELAGGSSLGVKKGDVNYSASKGMEINDSTGKDKYLTDPVPEGKPVPVEPQNVEVTDKELTCTLSVRCDTILNNIDWLDPEKVELVPEDGVIFVKQIVTFYEGESVFNVLLREMKKNKIHMEFVNTPMYNSAYIEGIHNLYEFDCGELSGWMYKVNGWFPNYGCSRYQLKEGDVVVWVYTCNLGIDVGGYYALGGE